MLLITECCIFKAAALGAVEPNEYDIDTQVPDLPYFDSNLYSKIKVTHFAIALVGFTLLWSDDKYKW